MQGTQTIQGALGFDTSHKVQQTLVSECVIGYFSSQLVNGLKEEWQLVQK